MGSYNQYKFNADTNDSVVLQDIVDFLRTRPEGSCVDVWKTWSERSKWGAEDLIVELSKKFPHVMFSMERSGESGNGKWIYLNGKEVNAEMFFKWPSKSLFQKKLNLAIKMRKQRNDELARAENEKAKREKEQRIKSLKEELAKLESK